ncbi:MAG: flagellar export chaperone FliS [Proteobacteria bacterium]|jgi:flagellar protein FliS|nr:flagellar export chaperone FliS [Pseudomonadota bacterium]
MSQARTAFAAYRSATEATVSKQRIVQMLLDGAVVAIQRAIDGFDIEEFGLRQQTIHNQITKAAAIVSQLRLALDLEIGGDFSKKLFGLYGYIGEQLIQGNLRKESEPLLEAKRHLAVIQEAWREMLAAQSMGVSMDASASRPASAPAAERVNFNMSV